MAEKNITITVSAKDLTSAELDKARRSLAGFGDEARKTRTSTDAAGGGMSSLATYARQLLPVLSVAGVVGGVISFGKELLNTADTLVKLSDKTGISIEGLQDLGHIAGQSGNTLEQLTSAVSQMQKRLANGEDSAVGALRQLNIEQSRFMALSPDEQFLAIAREVAKIEDPMQRVKVATDLFGKSGADVLPSLIADVDALRAAADKMSESTARAFDELGDRADAAWKRAKSDAANTLGALLVVVQHLPEFLKIYSEFGVTAAEAGDKTVQFALEQERVEKALLKLKKDGLAPTSSHFETLTAAVSHNTAEATRQAEVIKDVTSRIAELRGAVSTLTPQQRVWIDQLLDLGESQSEVAKRIGASSEAVALYVKQSKSATDVDKQREAAAKKLADQQKQQNELWARQTAGLQTLAGVTKNVDAIDQAYADSLDALANAYNLVSDEMTWYGQGTDEVAARTKEANYELMGLRGTMRSLADGLPSATVGMDGLYQKLTAGSDTTKEASKGWKDYKSWGMDALDGVSRVAEMAGNKTVSAIASIASTTIKAFATGGPVAGAIAGFTAVFSALSDKIFKTEGKKVNDLRDAYFGAAGGFEELHKKLIAAGADASFTKLWNAKTVKDWEAAVAEADAALQKLSATQGEIASLQQLLADRQKLDWEKADELATKYGGTLSGLGAKFEEAKLHAAYLELWNDWESLVDMGGDVGGMLTMVKEEVGHLVSESRRIGTEIPEQFRPVIEDLIKTGQLFDDNGVAITDLTGMKFGGPLVSEVDKIVKAIQDLTDALRGKLIPQIESIPRRIEIGVGYKYDPYNPPGGGGGGLEENFGYAAGGLVTRPQRAWIAERGEAEIVGPVAFMERALVGAMDRLSRRTGGGSSVSGGRTVIENRIFLDGRELTGSVVRWMPDVLAFAGVR